MAIRRKSEICRNDPEFKKMLQEIKIERIKLGKDKKILSDRRLTLALSRIPFLRDELIKSDILDENDR